jgi:hypothetical protein
VAAVIVFKICREHGIYADAKKEQARIANRLASLPGVSEIIPEYMRNEEAGPGYKSSVAVVVAAALLAILFCLSLVGPF